MLAVEILEIAGEKKMLRPLANFIAAYQTLSEQYIL